MLDAEGSLRMTAVHNTVCVYLDSTRVRRVELTIPITQRHVNEIGLEVAPTCVRGRLFPYTRTYDP